MKINMDSFVLYSFNTGEHMFDVHTQAYTSIYTHTLEYKW